MRVETRKRIHDGDSLSTSFITDVVLISESDDESKALDLIGGSLVGRDGLITTGAFEIRLADGYGEHYVLIRGHALKTEETT